MAGSGSRGDLQRLIQAKRTLGADWGELAGTVGSQLGANPDGSVSPAKFLTAYGKIPEASKRLLWGDRGQGLRKTYDDIATLATRGGQIDKLANPSGTAGALAHIGAAGAVAHALWNPAAIFPTALAAGGGKLLGHALASPVTAAPLARLIRAKQDYGVAQRLGRGLGQTLLSYQSAARDFANAAHSNLGTDLTPDQLMQ
jgi:hypothetical protein